MEPYHSFTSSRGTLVSSFLSSDASLPLEDDYHKLIPHDAKFTGFNLLVLSPTLPLSLPLKFDALMLSNDGAGGEITSHSLSPSAPCNVFSNAIEGGGDDWPKVRRGKAAFSSILESSTEREMSEEELVQRLFDMLAYVVFLCISSQLTLSNSEVNKLPNQCSNVQNFGIQCKWRRSTFQILPSPTRRIGCMRRDSQLSF